MSAYSYRADVTVAITPPTTYSDAYLPGLEERLRVELWLLLTRLSLTGSVSIATVSETSVAAGEQERIEEKI